MTKQFSVTGMTCAACSAHVERAAGQVPGVQEAAVNLMLGRLHVTYDESVTSPQAIIDAVIRSGYGAREADEADLAPDKQQEETVRRMGQRLLWSALCLVPLFYISMGHMMGLPVPMIFHTRPLVLALAELALLLPILILNRGYFTVGFTRLFRGSPNMDSLVALGAAAGIVYSLIEMYLLTAGHVTGMPDLYFESAGMILTLVTVGKYLEQRARKKTTGAISALLRLAPDSAVVRRHGEEITLPAAEILEGDTVIVRQGGKIPVDGVVTKGSAWVDESALTGESLPLEKTEGCAVSSATVVQSGYMEMEARRVGSDTTLSQIVRLMEEAASSKAPISRLVDRVSAVFVPVVITIALTASLLWYFVGGESVRFCLSVGIAVLVISCPCALGLATPVAIMVGTGKAAQSGILIKSAESLELLGRARAVVLDKTGTVTEGKPRVTDIVCASATEEELLQIAASVEAPSEHPLSVAISRAAQERGLPLSPVTEFAAVAGGGVQALLDGQRVLAGNEAFMKSVPISEAMRDQAKTLASQGKTALYFAREGELLGFIAVADVVKADSRAAIEALRETGREVVLLTGDNQVTAEAIAEQVGVGRVLAQVLPTDKAACVEKLQKEGLCTIMVGDGINDAPALARADVGMAIGAGTDIAIESADVVLMRSSLWDVVTATNLSRAVIRNIRENLFWAFIYNAIGIPVAAGVLYPMWGITLNPMIAAAAMSMSSVCVVANALRLRLWRGPICPKVENRRIQKEKNGMERIMSIEGMMCTHCSGRVESVLNALPGVRAKVDLEKKIAVISAGAEVTNDALRKAVEDAGYTVKEIR